MRKSTLTDALSKASRRIAPEPIPDANGRKGKKVIAGHFDAAVSKQLRQLALERDASVQALLGEALNDLFEKYGKPRLA